MTRAQAWELLTKYNKEPFHLQHAETVEGVMRWFAQELGYGNEADFWALSACCTISTLSSGRRRIASSAASCWKKAARTNG